MSSVVIPVVDPPEPGPGTPTTPPEAAGARLFARPSGSGWPATRQERDAVWAWLTGAPFAPQRRSGRHPGAYGRGVALLLDWLEAQPGTTWQDRWLLSGADTAGRPWRNIPVGWLSERGHPARWHYDAFFRPCSWPSAPISSALRWAG